MQTEIDGERTLTELDFARLNKLSGGKLPEGLVAIGQFPDLVESTEIAPDVVTMYSQVEIVDQGSGCRHKLTAEVVSMLFQPEASGDYVT